MKHLRLRAYFPYSTILSVGCDHLFYPQPKKASLFFLCSIADCQDEGKGLLSEMDIRVEDVTLCGLCLEICEGKDSTTACKECKVVYHPSCLEQARRHGYHGCLQCRSSGSVGVRDIQQRPDAEEDPIRPRRCCPRPLAVYVALLCLTGLYLLVGAFVGFVLELHHGRPPVIRAPADVNFNCSLPMRRVFIPKPENADVWREAKMCLRSNRMRATLSMDSAQSVTVEATISDVGFIFSPLNDCPEGQQVLAVRFLPPYTYNVWTERFVWQFCLGSVILLLSFSCIVIVWRARMEIERTTS